MRNECQIIEYNSIWFLIILILSSFLLLWFLSSFQDTLQTKVSIVPVLSKTSTVQHWVWYSGGWERQDRMSKSAGQSRGNHQEKSLPPEALEQESPSCNWLEAGCRTQPMQPRHDAIYIYTLRISFLPKRQRNRACHQHFSWLHVGSII